MKMILETEITVGPIRIKGLTAILTVILVFAGIYFAPEVIAEYISQPPQKIK